MSRGRRNQPPGSPLVGLFDPSALLEDSGGGDSAEARPPTKVAESNAPSREEVSVETFSGEDASVPTVGQDMETDAGSRTEEDALHFGTQGTTVLQAGDVVRDYELKALLGVGSFAEVFRATSRATQRVVALKILHQSLAGREPIRRRVMREGELLRSLRHPNLIEVYDVGVLEDGRAYVSMELLRGRTLKELVFREGPMHPDRVIRLLQEIASGLDAAHRAGIIHRDLKPANIIVTDDPNGERVKILDFGLARLVDRGELTQLTYHGDLVGSPAFMSPEQIRNPLASDARADLYALGITAYAMLTGELPFKGAPAEVLEAHSQKAVPSLPPMGGMEHIVERLTQKDPDDRFPSAARLLEALEELSPPDPPGSATWPRQVIPMTAPVGARRLPRSLVFGMVAVAIGMLVATGLISSRVEERKAMPPPIGPTPPPLQVEVRAGSTEVEPTTPSEPPDPAPHRDPTPTKPSPRAKAAVVSVRARGPITRALAARSLRFQDGSGLLPKASALREDRLPPEQLDRVLEQIEQAPITAQLLRRRLARVLGKLEALSNRDPESSKLVDLESRYFNLRASLARTRDAAELEQLNLGIEACEFELDQASSSN